MHKLTYVLFAAALVGGCDDDDFDDDDAIDVDDDGDGDGTTPPPSGVIEWRANVEPTNTTLQLMGNAVVRMTEGEQSFTASLEMRNDVPGAVRPWHVHFGNCGSGGPIVGTDNAYPRLTVGSGGAATSDVIVRVGLDPVGAYHVNVHESDQYFTTIIACGDLILQ
jgi:hypothetical protein